MNGMICDLRLLAIISVKPAVEQDGLDRSVIMIQILSGPTEPSPLHKLPLHEPRFLRLSVWRPGLLLIERR